MKNEKFAVFILTHGRVDRVKTYDALRRQGYTGDVYIVIDNEDESAPAYYERFGKMVVMFDKAAIAQTFDECDTLNLPRKSVVYARNACFDIARQLSVKYFLQLDDDYNKFEYRVVSGSRLLSYLCRNLDKLFKATLSYYQSIPALAIAFSQGGDMLGGAGGSRIDKITRKAMNTFFCSVDRPFQFTGRLNEDVNMYTALGHRGALIFTIPNASIVQVQSQRQDGGMTDIYESFGTYVKSFYTLMQAPSFVTIKDMGETVRRLHHRVDWPTAVPNIIHEKYCKRLSISE